MHCQEKGPTNWFGMWDDVQRRRAAPGSQAQFLHLRGEGTIFTGNGQLQWGGLRTSSSRPPAVGAHFSRGSQHQPTSSYSRCSIHIKLTSSERPIRKSATTLSLRKRLNDDSQFRPVSLSLSLWLGRPFSGTLDTPYLDPTPCHAVYRLHRTPGLPFSDLKRRPLHYYLQHHAGDKPQFWVAEPLQGMLTVFSP